MFLGIAERAACMFLGIAERAACMLPGIAEHAACMLPGIAERAACMLPGIAERAACMFLGIAERAACMFLGIAERAACMFLGIAERAACMLPGIAERAACMLPGIAERAACMFLGISGCAACMLLGIVERAGFWESQSALRTDDREVMRLISELERSVSLLPAVMGNTHFQAELALTLQPLRSENAQLRRRLRILNQQLRDRERQDQGERVDASISFQTLNEALQKQLDESRKDIQSLQSKTQELLRVMEAQQEENQKLARTVHDKDQELRLILWQQESTETRTKTDLGESLVKMKINLDSCEKENKVLEVTLRQREGEVSRLRELTRTLQASMAKLLCDLGREHGKSSTGPNLTRALLDSYEKQLREENIPASASIIRYLKQVKTEQALPGQNPDCPSVSNTFTSTGTGRCLTPEGHTEPGHSQPNHLLPSSLRRAQLVPSQRHMCTPPMADMGARVCETGAANRMCCSVGDREDSQNGDEFDFKKTLQPSPNKTHRRTKPEGGNPSEPGLARCPLTQPTTSPEDKGHNLAMSDFTSGKPDWTIASFSTFTSHDEQDFRNGLAALDANIAKLHHTLQAGMLRK
uniref:Coiled-coil domain-containing protein 14 n=1 Tax=Leptobrachium leishanense TaxID=445787 RepID=A0A8C5QRN6_9ANUR